MAAPKKSAKVTAAREAAFQILLEVEQGTAHADILLRTNKVERLSTADKALTTALVLGTLRWQLALDAITRQHLVRPNAKLDAPIRIALRLGTLQLTQMDRIPAHAAISESVELVKQAGHRFASGMVNAVLRKVSAASHSFVATDAYPAWMLERWRTHYGEQVATAICEHGQQQPALHLRLTSSTSEATLQQSGIELAPGSILAAARTLLKGDAANIPAAQARIQDEGSQLIAELAGKGSAILDACAAPGGKTLILAECNPTAQITAYEASESRYEALRKRLATTPNIAVHHADATMLTECDAFDLALVDTPCSGTGTLGRNPEIRHRLTPESFAEQHQRQCALLASALRAVKPGGYILYSTCSLEPEENELVIEEILASYANACVVPFTERVNTLALAPNAAEKLHAAITPEGYLKLLPTYFGTDGFFACLIERTQ